MYRRVWQVFSPSSFGPVSGLAKLRLVSPCCGRSQLGFGLSATLRGIKPELVALLFAVGGWVNIFLT